MIGNILFAGGMVGLLITIFLFNRKDNLVPNIILGITFSAYSIDILYAFFITQKLYFSYPSFIGLNGVLPFIYSPAIYSYVKSLSSNKKRFEIKFLLHFAPAIIILLASIIGFFIFSSEEKLALLNPDVPKSIFIIIMRTLIPFYGFTYIIMSLIEIKKYHHRLKENYSEIESLKINWLIYLILSMTLVWMLEFIQIFLIDVAGKPENIFYKYIYLAISLIMFLIVYRSLNQPQIFSEVNFNEAEENNEPKNEVEESGYYKSGLTEQKINEIASSLIIIMQNDKPYLKSNLSLSDLAQLNGVSAHNLSEVINTKLNKTFYDFINQYRVDEVKKMLNDVKYENYSILSIGFEAGFNSKTSFNTIFKKFTGTTPSEYKRTNRS